MAASKCFCCGTPLKAGGSRACDALSFYGRGDTFLQLYHLLNFVLVTFLIVEACLLAGSVRNAYHTKCTTQFFNQPPSCKTVRNGVFAAGAAFIVFTGIISEFYYTSYFKARGSFAPYRGEDGVGMASYK
ncbi:hypothetical protein ACS0TY_015471 [Phlomoides rotata]